MNTPRTTLGMIAEKAGVSRATVSRALRNHPQIPQSTCQRIQLLAREMDWRPDPEATRLMQHLQASKRRPIDSALGLINDFPRRSQLLADPYTRRLLESAKARAATLGFRIDEIWLREKGMTARRASSILRSRGIRGVLIPPEVEPLPRIELDWDHLSAVATTTTALPARMHRVLPDNYNNFRLVMEQVQSRGWKRPMLLSLRHLEARTEHCPTNVYLATCCRSPALAVLPVFYWDDLPQQESLTALAVLLRQHKPDGLIVADTWLHEASGGKLPWVCYSNGGHGHAGIDQRPEVVGSAAVDMLSAHVMRGESGLPETPKVMHIGGCWIED